LAFSRSCVVEWQDFWGAVFVQTWGAFTATFVALATWAAFATVLTFTTFAALSARFALFVAAFGVVAALFAGHALVACFGACFGLGFR
jgi:hypothetical protein